MVTWSCDFATCSHWYHQFRGAGCRQLLNANVPRPTSPIKRVGLGTRLGVDIVYIIMKVKVDQVGVQPSVKMVSMYLL